MSGVEVRQAPQAAKITCPPKQGGCILVVTYGPRPDSYTLETVTTLASALVSPPSLVVHVVCMGLLGAAALSPRARGGSLRVERFVAMSATCALYAALCSKSMSMLVITSGLTKTSQLGNWGFYGFCAGFVCFAVGQIHFMNMALKYGLACSVIPMYEGLSLVGQVFFGGILFREFANFKGHNQLGFWPGIFCVLLGLILLVDHARSQEGAAGNITLHIDREQEAAGADDGRPASEALCSQCLPHHS